MYSKHKWVLDAEISTTGAPYTDTFKVQLRTLVTSDEAGNYVFMCRQVCSFNRIFC